MAAECRNFSSSGISLLNWRNPEINWKNSWKYWSLKLRKVMMSSDKKNTLEANLEDFRISNIQSMAFKLLRLEAGYEGNFNFVDGSPSMFWIHQESPGLSQLQNWARD